MIFEQQLNKDNVKAVQKRYEIKKILSQKDKGAKPYMISVSDVDSPSHDTAFKYMESMKPADAQNFAQLAKENN